jgi:hypothetical protein
MPRRLLDTCAAVPGEVQRCALPTRQTRDSRTDVPASQHRDDVAHPGHPLDHPRPPSARHATRPIWH